jgi:hypothetical protein
VDRWQEVTGDVPALNRERMSAGIQRSQQSQRARIAEDAASVCEGARHLARTWWTSPPPGQQHAQRDQTHEHDLARADR